MSIRSRISGTLGRLGRRAGFATFALAAAIGAAAFFAAALFLALAHALGPIAACLITGAALAALAAVVAVLGMALSRPPPQQSLFAGLLDDPSGLFGIVAALVRRDPRKAMLAAAIAGVVLEVLAGGGKGRK